VISLHEKTNVALKHLIALKVSIAISFCVWTYRVRAITMPVSIQIHVRTMMVERYCIVFVLLFCVIHALV